MNLYILVVTLFSISKIHSFFCFWFSFFSFCFHSPLLICHLCSIPWTKPAKTEADGKQRKPKPKPNRKKGTIFSIFQSLASPVFSNQNNVKCDQGSLRQLGQKSSLLGGQDRSGIFLQNHAVFDRIWQTQCVFSKIIKKLYTWCTKQMSRFVESKPCWMTCTAQKLERNVASVLWYCTC